MSERTTGEASGTTDRPGFARSLAALAAVLGFAWLNLPALFRQPPGQERRPSLKPPSRSVKRRG